MDITSMRNYNISAVKNNQRLKLYHLSQNSTGFFFFFFFPDDEQILQLLYLRLFARSKYYRSKAFHRFAEIFLSVRCIARELKKSEKKAIDRLCAATRLEDAGVKFIKS